MSAESSIACEHCAREEARKPGVSLRGRFEIAALSAAIMALGLLIEAQHSWQFWSEGIFLLSIVLSGRWVIPRGLRGAADLHLDMNFLMTVAAFGAVLIGAAAEGSAVMLLFFVAELLEEKADERVRTEIGRLVELQPPMVTVLDGHSEVHVPSSSVALGTTLIIRPGDVIGLDGVVIEGSSTVNQAPITGESLPVAKSVGDSVFSGTVNQEGHLRAQVTKASSDTVLSRIVKLVDEAKKKRAPSEKFVSRFSHVYTPVMVLLSVLLAVVSLLFGLTLTDSVYRGLTLLVTSCPCALAISVPVSMVSSMAGSARSGILVKGSEYIEKISKTNTVALDKTGTLTRGRLAVTKICLHNGSTRSDVLRAAVSLERMSGHPIAYALVEEAEAEGIEETAAFQFSTIPGLGIRGEMQGKTYWVGSKKLLEQQHVITETESDPRCEEGTSVYVAEEQKHIGTLILGDVVRPEAHDMVAAFRKRGIRTVMLTGDNNSAAKTVATEVEVDEYHSGLMPQEKVELIEELRNSGVVVMVGDGVNDAPAMVVSDVGVAMGAIGSDVAIETADVALMGDDLSRLPGLIDRARRTMRVVRQNIAISILVKLVIGFLAVFGLISLWFAIALGDMGLSLLVIANALKLAGKT